MHDGVNLLAVKDAAEEGRIVDVLLVEVEVGAGPGRAAMPSSLMDRS